MYENPNIPVNYKNIITTQLNKNIETDEYLDIQRRAIIAHNSAHDMVLRNDYETKHGECMVRENLSKREKHVRQWERNLKDEIQSVTKQHRITECCLRDVAKAINYFRNILEVSEQCIEYRKALVNPSKETDDILQMESSLGRYVIAEMEDKMKKLKASLAELEKIKNPLNWDLDAKANNFLALKGCKNTKPLMFDKYDLVDPMIPYEPETEEQWEKNSKDLVEYSQYLRQESGNICTEAENAIKDCKTQVTNSWLRASRALAEEVYRDTYIVNRCHEHLGEVEKCISRAHLRIDTMHDEFETDDREKQLEVWRSHRLNYRPKTENIKDRVVLRIEDELNELENRMQIIAEHFQNDEKLLIDLFKLKEDLIRTMDAASKRLHANRENCQGIRRAVVIDGLDNSVN